MSDKRHSLRQLVKNQLRIYAVAPTVALFIIGLICMRFTYGWIFFALSAAACLALIWYLTQGAAERVTYDLDNLIKSIEAFDSGILTVRFRGASTSEIRQLVDGINKMATTAEQAIVKLSKEEKRQMQFVSDVSHELRTPLTAIRGAAETLLEGGVPEEAQSRFLSTIASESERLTRLANDLLTLQRIEGARGELPMRRLNLRNAAERAARALAPLITDRAVQFEIIGQSPDVLGDIDRIQQVISNLVDNATRMVGEGGKVWIELSSAYRHELGSTVTAKSFVDIDRFAIMAICDNGPGIPADNIPRLFDRFYRTDLSRARNRGGAGLGLSIVKAIIDAHGGEIEVENRVGGGTQFTVYLPVPPEMAPRSSLRA